MIVIADTSINYLILINEIHVLEQLYDRIVLPLAVQNELLHPKAPTNVQAWLSIRPAG